jgi:hypothetical protein
MYVLQPELQDAKKIGICLPQARRDMYLGVSPVHSSSVALALNLTTGFISPQFNVVHDDLFATVTSHWDDGTFDPDHWNTIIQSGQEHYCDPSTHPTPLTDDWISPSEQAVQEQRRQFHRRRHASARQRGYLRLRDHLPGGGIPQPNSLPHNLPEHPPQAAPEAPIQVPSQVSPASPAPLPHPDYNPDLPQEENQNQNKETGIPIHENITRT